ncbi:MAG: 2-C-methyl-D-erythritol 2,4-cyclodiphosphate synthase [Acidobacteriota bacterium]
MIRTGFGYDIHSFAPGRALVLGGVRIPFELGLLGHSDADVLVHAICDSLLGAAALGDIGRHFPDTDPRFKDVSSLEFLATVRRLLIEGGFEICNLDSTLVLQRPKIASFIPEMQRNLAASLQIDPSQVSVKATTNEQLGALGRGEGCAAYAVATVQSASPPAT